MSVEIFGNGWETGRGVWKGWEAFTRGLPITLLDFRKERRKRMKMADRITIE